MLDIRTLLKPIIYSLTQGKKPKYTDFEGITLEDFAKAVEMAEDEGYIKGAQVSRGGMENKVIFVWSNTAEVKKKGYDYLEGKIS